MASGEKEQAVGEASGISATPFEWVDPAEWTPSAEYVALRDEAERLKPLACDLIKPPQYECGSTVLCRGQALGEPIYWQGRQWAVTPHGVERRDGGYVIGTDDLWRGEESFGWVLHMARKLDVDLPDFTEALRIARRRERLIRGPR